MTKAKIIIVNENDEIIGHKERETLNQSDMYRVSALWIQNSKDQILLAQRSFDKKNNPGQWGPAVAGTIDEGESYESNIIKEAEEEIGLKNHNFQKSHNNFNNGNHKHFTQWFFALVDKELEQFTIQKEEVEKIKWFTKEELLEEINSSPNKFLKSMKDTLNFFNK